MVKYYNLARNNGKNYQPQLVSRISSHQQYVKAIVKLKKSKEVVQGGGVWIFHPNSSRCFATGVGGRSPQALSGVLMISSPS